MLEYMKTSSSSTVISLLSRGITEPMVMDEAGSICMEYSPRWCYRTKDEWMKRVPKCVNYSLI